MRKLRLFLFMAFLGLVAGSCSGSEITYPTPDDTDKDPPDPKPGIVVVGG